METQTYYRGSKVISAQIDRELTAAERSAANRSMLVECGKLRRENEALKAENERLRQAWEKRGVYLAAEREQRQGMAQQLDAKHESMMGWLRTANRLTLQAKKLTAILRMFTPEQVEEAHEAAKQAYPHLWR